MTAILNRVAEVSTSVGTGNFVLGGAYINKYGASVRTFINALNGLPLSFFYTILHDTQPEYESGVGYLDNGALVRLKVFNSSNANGLVNFSAGSKSVICADDASIRALWSGGPFQSAPSNAHQIPVNWHNNVGTSGPMVADYVTASPYDFETEKTIATWMIAITGAGTGPTYIRAALAERIAANTYKVVLDLGFLDGSTTGDKIFPGGTNVVIPAGRYFLLTHSNGTPSVRKFGSASYPLQLGASYFTGFLFTKDSMSGAPANAAWPASLTISGGGAINNDSHPAVYYRETTTRAYV